MRYFAAGSELKTYPSIRKGALRRLLDTKRLRQAAYFRYSLARLRPPTARRNATAASGRYVMIFEGRSGSTHLTDLLGSHPDITALHEKLGAFDSRQAQADWLHQLYGDSSEPKTRVIGFKTKLRAILDPRAVAETLRERNVRVIHLDRRNVVKQVVSQIRAAQLHRERGRWNITDSDEAVAPALIHPAEFKRVLRHRMRINRQLGEFVACVAQPTLKIEYEDLLADEPAVLRRLLEFLEIEPQPLRSAYKKHTADDLRSVVLNLEELRDSLPQEPYGSMFDEGAAVPAPGLGT